MKRVASPWFVLAFLAIVPACAVGPAYKKPPVTVPSAFAEAPPGDWQSAKPRDGVTRAEWWKAFADPLLNEWEPQVSSANQTLSQAEAALRGARAAVRGARTGLFPTIAAGASATTARGGVVRQSSSTANETTTTYEVPADLTYEADLWGRVRRGVEASRALAQASAADLETARLSLQAELAANYFQLRGVDAQSRLLSTTVSGYERALEITTRRHEQGVASGADVAQAQTQLETTRAQAIDLQIARAQLQHAIAVLMGRTPEEVTIPVEIPALLPPVLPPGLPADLIERRPDIAGAERRVAAANAEIGVARAAFFPSLTLDASGGFESSVLSKLLSWPSRVWSLGPALAQTIFDGGRRRSQSEQARASYDGAVAAYRESVLEALQQVEDNLAALRVLADEARQQDIAVSTAERSLDLAQKRYEQGVTGYLEVVTAQAAALSARAAQVEVNTRRMSASVALVKALGGGWSETNVPAAGS